MNEFDIFSAIGGVGEDILEEAETAAFRSGIRKISVIPLTAAAACIAVLGLGIYIAGRNDDIGIAPGDTGINSITTVPVLPEFTDFSTAPEIHGTDPEQTVTTVPEELISETTVEPTETTVPPCGFPAYTGETMPLPFYIPPESGGDMNANFYSTTNLKLGYLDMSFIRLVDHDTAMEWLDNASSVKSDLTSVGELFNLYSFIRHFNIPDETVRELLVEMRNGSADDFSDEEIDLIISGDNEAVAEHFVSEYAIVIGENLYSPKWIYNHPIKDYEAAGITPEMLAEKIPLYSQIHFSDEARTAFSEKLSAYIGRTVVIEPVRYPETIEPIDEPVFDEDFEIEIPNDDTPEEPAELAEEQMEVVTAREIR